VNYGSRELWRGPLFIRTGARLDPTPEESVMILRLERTPADLDLDEPLSAEWRTAELW
jgi:aminoglycoside 2'-N-acetyltransferase I